MDWYYNPNNRGVGLSKTGDVVVSKQSWSLISDRCDGIALDKKLTRGGEVKVIRVTQPFAIAPLPAIDIASLSADPLYSAAVRAYVPRYYSYLSLSHSLNS
jgi:hypothetical protein